MNLRKSLYFTLFRLRGQRLGSYYEHLVKEEKNGIPPDTTKRLLTQLLSHCRESVPYYAEVMRKAGDLNGDPEEYLLRLPILTKDIIRTRFNQLQSSHLSKRRWYYNTSGGSTGEPVRFIQDWEYAAQSGALKLLYSKLAGKEVGEPEVILWGSEWDIIRGAEKLTHRLINTLANTTLLNAFLMGERRMRQYIAAINAKRPKLIVAYAESVYELARFSEREGLEILPPGAVITSAGTLHPFMRETIERVFGCRVFNRYGSREVGDIACERRGFEGLWVAPWGNYIEIVDREGNRVPDGSEGDILVTSLNNFAMPFIRYRIGDLGVLSRIRNVDGSTSVQVLDKVLGRSVDVFKTKTGALVHPGYFMVLLFFKDWIRKYQVIQKSLSRILIRIVRSGSRFEQGDLEEIITKTKLVMGDDCEVMFEFLDEIPASSSGKYRYTVSEIRED